MYKKKYIRIINEKASKKNKPFSSDSSRSGDNALIYKVWNEMKKVMKF